MLIKSKLVRVISSSDLFIACLIIEAHRGGFTSLFTTLLPGSLNPSTTKGHLKFMEGTNLLFIEETTNLFVHLSSRLSNLFAYFFSRFTLLLTKIKKTHFLTKKLYFPSHFICEEQIADTHYQLEVEALFLTKKSGTSCCQLYSHSRGGAFQCPFLINSFQGLS